MGIMKKIFFPWRKIRRSIRRQSNKSLILRRNDWEQFAKLNIIEILYEIKEKLKNDIAIFIRSPEDNCNSISSIGYETIEVTLATLPTGIIFKQKSDTKTTYSQAIELGGAIRFEQSEQGLIVISFFPAIIDIPKIKYEFHVPNKYAHNIFIYGYYEPNRLTKRKLKRIITRGICFMIETHVGAKQSFYTKWIILKTNDFYKGILIGVISSAAVSSIFEICSYIHDKF